MTTPSPQLREAFTEALGDLRRRNVPKGKRWSELARLSQLAPVGLWWIWLLLTGRGWGKNRTQSEWVHERAERTPGSCGFVAGRTLGDIARNCIRHPQSGLIATQRPTNPCEFKQGKAGGYIVRWRNGTYAEVHTSEEPDRARGGQYQWGIADEVATWKRVVDFEGNTTWTNLLFGLRHGEAPQLVAGTTPRRGSLLLKEILADAERDPTRVRVTRGSTQENAANLSPDFLKFLRSKFGGTHLERQEIDGEVLPNVEGALVTSEMIDATRVAKAPALTRIAVGVDPSGGRAEQGIIGAGLGEDGDGYVLADRSGRFSPEGWGRRVVNLYVYLRADRVVAETNFGGDMVVSTVRTVDRRVPVHKVTASRGKHVRFEPVGSLYEQGRIHHVGTFPQLEDEVTCFTAEDYQGEESPNRADAGVWALTDLMLGDLREPGDYGVTI